MRISDWSSDVCSSDLCPDIGDLMYADVCALGSQLARLYEQVPQDKVFVYTLDELRDDTPLLWQKIQHFLGVPDDGRRSFPVLNEAKRVPNAFSTFRRMVVQAKINQIGRASCRERVGQYDAISVVA